MDTPTHIYKIVSIDPEDFRIWIEPYICSFHKEKPGEFFAGCSCCSGYGMFPKDTKAFVEKYKPKNFDAVEELFRDLDGQDSL